MSHIIAFGNPVYDDITTPSSTTGERVLSGCATNGCIALTALGHDTSLVGRIGNDYYERFVADMRRQGITPIVERADETAGFRLIYDERGDRSLDVLGQAGAIAVDHVPDSCAQADAIIIGPILQEVSYSLIERIQAMSSAPLFLDPQGLLRTLDAAQRIDHYANPEMATIAPRCMVIKANELETTVLTGVNPCEEPSRAARHLHNLGCRIAVVTLADQGSLIDNGTAQYHIPAYKTDVCDPTGAGDTYMAGFLHAFLRDPDDLITAGCTGAATSSIWIEHTGPEAPIRRDEVARRTEYLLRHCTRLS
jgi:sugar/nucleoside kinase (ribokinase family)